MHDWTLIDIRYLWESKICEIKLLDNSSEVVRIVANGVLSIHIPHLEEWGPSQSVNSVSGPTDENDIKLIKIEMQSGDVISVTANEIEIEN